MLEEVKPNIIIATDGSIREGVTAWGGTVWKDRVIVYEWSAAKHGRASSFRAESEALEDALTWLSRNTQSEDNAIILTDSLSLVSKMVGGKLKEGWERLIQKIQGRLTISYIPGHAGIPFNERADKLAGEATPIGMQTRSPADVTAAATMQYHEREERNMLDHWSVVRLKDRGWKRGYILKQRWESSAGGC